MLTVLLFLVFLRPDPARKPLPPADSERIQAAHMANIRSMASNGILMSAGPFNDTPTTISGIFILKAASLSEAQRIAASDPTVLEHRNIVEVHPWRGPAGIADEYFRLHKENPATPEGMAEHPLCLIYGATSPARLIDQLHSEGRLGAAGTIEDGGGLVALVIFKPGSVEDARRLLETDPAIKSGQLRVEYHHWWCSAHVLPW
jgi:uncharacterized protein YciI